MYFKENIFEFGKPKNRFLSTFVDTFFYVGCLVADLDFKQETIVPFPRASFGYFFDNPFKVTNHTKNETFETQMIFSKASIDNISVEPLTDQVRIIGAHVKSYALSYFTRQKIGNLSWYIKVNEIFKKSDLIESQLNNCQNPKQMFDIIESYFLDNILIRDLSKTQKAIEIIEQFKGDIEIKEVASILQFTERTLRNIFFSNVGCSPKEYIALVKMKMIAFDLVNSQKSMTDIALDNNFYDQAHFNNSIKKTTGTSPKKLKNDIPDFRFFQF
ncbi:helix-turn-helix transcriptional regulator [Elizabethkingia miricola]|uniref:Helix-turn-helix transcriptional regulator n=2 Tax=Elizabethkingia miricola TaxID=172045 RepID=A0ABD5B5Y0_ELIMR|nr:helix-turn-helix transcriptional regulator [Elizabethkingia miricola]MDQ8748799.1 helix-turn-helix transcriptional regulator [Elizabethkingia miricola]NHQ67522.1 helix-turn-helix transcriptional regulator [Elizabethkingia miricola]NHQ72042.1 helix-turn-helix transcriptional regulator [Elizabethkingia miricola]OPB88409.1 hypothetical protein BAS06_14735 [Elizabethkingia miricola]PSL87347.1 AraC family transcriptional regulator [Elizabethkingia miricola]